MERNVRVLVTEQKVIGGTNELIFRPHEVYYNTKGNLDNFNPIPVQITSNDLEEFKSYFDTIKKSIDKKPLWGDERFPQEYDRKSNK